VVAKTLNLLTETPKGRRRLGLPRRGDLYVGLKARKVDALRRAALVLVFDKEVARA
jgi:hypothetical protein